MRGYRNYSVDPHPGELREQIDILREVSIINENGYPESHFEPVYQKVWTTADDAGNQTFRAGDSEIAQGVINFVIRYRAGIEVGMFVVFGGERREITDIGNYGFKHRYLGLQDHNQPGGEHMKRIQDALAPTGFPAYAGVWRPTAEYKSPPPQYLVYSTLTVEADHNDDALVQYKVYVYLNLWSIGDVTQAVRKVRVAMRAAGFQMQDETDRGYNQPAYNTDADLFSVFWTWVLRVDAAEEDAPDEHET